MLCPASLQLFRVVGVQDRHCEYSLQGHSKEFMSPSKNTVKQEATDLIRGAGGSVGHDHGRRRDSA